MTATGSPLSNMVESSEFMPIGNIPISSSIMVPSLQAYTDHNLSTHPYSLVHYPGIRHNAQSSPESSGYRSPRPAVEPSHQSVKMEEPAISISAPRQSSSLPTWVALY